MPARLLLVLFLFLVGFDLGAGVYEMEVTGPVWRKAWVDHDPDAEALVQKMPNAGMSFWIFVTPTLGVVALATFLTSWTTSKPHRRWRLFATGLELLVVATTFAYFVPNIMMFLEPTHGGLAPDLVAQKADMWLKLNLWRVVGTSSAWLLALRAITVPSSKSPVTAA